MTLIPKGEFVRHEPKGGWKPQTWYLAEAAYASNNPVHNVLVFSGFLDEKGQPAGYSCVQSVTGGEQNPISKVKYLKPIRELYACTDDD